MTKETLRKAKELASDLEIIEHIIDMNKNGKWIKIVTPFEYEDFLSTRFQDELADWLREKQAEYEKKLKEL